MITTPTQCGYEVHFSYPISLTGGDKKGETHSKYADLPNVVQDIFSITPQGVGVDASVSLGQDVVHWRPSKTTSETLREKVIVSLI